MAEENKTLEFKITTSAELAGAQATAAALEKQIGKAKALGQDYAALSAQLARVKAAIAATGGGAEMFGVHMVSLGEGMHKAEEKMEGIGGESRELYRIFYELDRLVPGLGESLRAVFTGPLGYIGLLVYGLYEVVDAFEAYNKKLDEVAAKAAQPLDGGIETAEKAWDAAAIAAGKYQAALDNAGKDTDAVTEAVKNAKEISDAQIAGVKKVIAAYGELMVAKLKGEDASPEAIARAKLETQEALTRLDEQKSAEQLKKEFEIRKAAAAGLAEAVKAAQAAVIAPDQKYDALETELKNLRAANEHGDDSKGLTTQANTDAAEKMLRIMEAMRRGNVIDLSELYNSSLFSAIKAPVGIDFNGLTYAQAQDRLQTLIRAFEDQKILQKRLEQQEKEVSNNKSTADERLQKAQNANTTNQAFLNEYPRLLQQAQAVAGVQQQYDQQADTVKKFTGLFGNGGITKAAAQAIYQQAFDAIRAIIGDARRGQTPQKIVNDAAAAEAVEATGQTLTPRQQKAVDAYQLLQQRHEEIENLTDLLNGLGENTTVILRAIENSHDVVRLQQKQINNLSSRIDKLNQQAQRNQPVGSSW